MEAMKYSSLFGHLGCIESVVQPAVHTHIYICAVRFLISFDSKLKKINGKRGRVMEDNKENAAVESQLPNVEQRCKCNKLICVIKDDDIEIKCNKCKRIMVIRTKGIKRIDVY